MFGLFGNKSHAEVLIESVPKDAALILDVRTDEEYRQGHVKGAVNIPLGELPNRMDEIAAHLNQAVVIYCQSGARSKRAVRFLESQGFTQILHLHKGYRSLGR